VVPGVGPVRGAGGGEAMRRFFMWLSLVINIAAVLQGIIFTAVAMQAGEPGMAFMRLLLLTANTAAVVMLWRWLWP
jgi:hypothetical protein